MERRIVVEDLPNNLDVVNGNMTELESALHLLQAPHPMEEPPSEEFVGVSVNNDAPRLVDLSHVIVPSPQHVSDPMNNFNGAVMNNELEEEVFQDRKTGEVESDKGWSSTKNDIPAPLFSFKEGRVLCSVLGEVPSVHAFDDVRIADKVICANGLKSRNDIADPDNDLIRKSMLFSKHG